MRLVSIAVHKLKNIQLAENMTPTPANEAGWKETVLALPNQVTRMIATFERPRCHTRMSNASQSEEVRAMTTTVDQKTWTDAEG